MAYVEDKEMDTVDATTAHGASRQPRLRWYQEVVTIVAFYLVYSMIRNVFGSNAVSPGRALRNATRVIEVEKFFGGFVEADIQRFFLDWGATFIRIWNLYYGSLHFVVTGGVMVWLYRRHPARYPRWRNTLGATTGLALLGFSMFPLMPPRLLGSFGPFGGADFRYTDRFVDTLSHFPALWSFNSSTMQSVSNQYASMPSLHVGWALWCTLAVFPLLRTRWSKAFFSLYVPFTVFTIVVTANHYWLDAVGGAVVFGAGYAIAGRLELLKSYRRRPVPALVQIAGRDDEDAIAR